MGGLIGVGGTLAGQLAIEEDYEARRLITGVSLGTGAIFGGCGVLALLLKSDFEKNSELLRMLPEETEQQISRKIITGEANVQSLSDKARSSRLMGAGLYGVTGIAQLVYYFTFADSLQSEYALSTSYLGSMFLYDGILWCGFSLVYLLIETPAEREAISYREWKAGKGISRTTASGTVKIALDPVSRRHRTGF